MRESKYQFSIDKQLLRVYIIDNCDGNQMSVTNDAENVVQSISKQIIHPESYRWFYKDTDGIIDEIVPDWEIIESGILKCVDVQFKSINVRSFNEI